MPNPPRTGCLTGHPKVHGITHKAETIRYEPIGKQPDLIRINPADRDDSGRYPAIREPLPCSKHLPL